MGLQQQKQAIQSQGLTIQQQQQNLAKGAADTQMTQQSAQQRQGIANIDWSKYEGPDGVVSTDKMLDDPQLRQQAGDQFLDVMTKAASARNLQLQGKQALAGLTGTLRDQFGATVGALRTDPDVVADNAAGREKVTQAISNFSQSGGPDAARVGQIYGGQVAHVPQGGLAQAVSNVQLQAQSAGQQTATQAPSYLGTGNQAVQTNPQAAGGSLFGAPSAQSTSIPMGIPPTTPVVDAAGNQRLLGQPGQPGPVTGLGPMAAGNATSAATIRQSANEAASTYPQGQFNNNQIIKLAQDPNALGHGGDLLAKLGGGYAGVPWTSDASTNWNNIGHFMGLQAITQMKAAGLAGTDADKSLAQSVTGDRSYTADSIVSIARVNRALGEGSRLYNEGVERAFATGDPSAVTSFKNQWSSSANVDGFLLYNAKRSKDSDPGALQAEVQQMGGVNSPRYKAALKSIDQMRGLITGNGP